MFRKLVLIMLGLGLILSTYASPQLGMENHYG